jgi:hypothetical protein
MSAESKMDIFEAFFVRKKRATTFYEMKIKELELAMHDNKPEELEKARTGVIEAFTALLDLNLEISCKAMEIANVKRSSRR